MVHRVHHVSWKWTRELLGLAGLSEAFRPVDLTLWILLPYTKDISESMLPT